MESLTIVTPSLNHGAFIGEAVDSVCIGAPETVQHIVVDGGSTDETLAVLAGRGLDLEVRPGTTSHQAMEIGLRLARAEIVGFLNADDRYDAGALDAVLTLFRHSPTVAAVCGGARFFTRNPDGSERELARRGHLAGAAMMLELTFGAPAFNSWFFRRNLLEQVGGIETAWDFAADRDLLLRVIRDTQPLMIDRLVYHYRVHGGSRTLRPDLANRTAITAEHVILARRHLPFWPAGSETARMLTAWWAFEWLKLRVLGGPSILGSGRPPLSALPRAWRLRRRLRRMLS